jgi:dTDP-D-glucose 4,6-dehydratase
MILNAVEGKPLPVLRNGMNVRTGCLWKTIAGPSPGAGVGMPGGVQHSAATANAAEPPKSTICRLVDQRLEPQHGPCDSLQFVKDRPGHDRRYAIDCSKLSGSSAGDNRISTGLALTAVVASENSGGSSHRGKYRRSDWNQPRLLKLRA